jgi:aspartyl-tRNA(Asn)/glutamyl-tRNA(Gln) amidotransferase subunit C
MSIDKTIVRKVAKLARIKIAEAEEEGLTGELNSILKMIAELNAANTEGVEPLTSVIDMHYPSRPDEVTDGDRQAEITANAPEETAGFFVVQKIVE